MISKENILSHGSVATPKHEEVFSDSMTYITNPIQVKTLREIKSPLKPQLKKRSISQSDIFEKYEYFHPGNWIKFDFENEETWSCCLNFDFDSKVKIIINDY